MKMSPDEAMQQQRLTRSKISAAGFLGDDPRPYDQVIADDATTLRRLGLDVADLATVLQAVVQRAQAAMGAPVVLAPGIRALHYEAMGRIPSPIPGDGAFAKGETRIEWEDGRCLRVTPLGLALLERHGFCQGEGSLYRIDPELASHLVRAIKGGNRIGGGEAE